VSATLPAVATAPADATPARAQWLTFLTRLARRRTALFGLAVVVLVIVTSLAAPLLTPFDPIEQDIAARLKAPGERDAAGRLHPLGTDHLGRDLLARVIYGAQPALLVGFAAVVISGLLGMAAGLLGGYFGGWIDDVLMRLADIQLAFVPVSAFQHELGSLDQLGTGWAGE
jgi:peptide/nickel transport system permease protein